MSRSGRWLHIGDELVEESSAARNHAICELNVETSELKYHGGHAHRVHDAADSLDDARIGEVDGIEFAHCGTVENHFAASLDIDHT